MALESGLPKIVKIALITPVVLLLALSAASSASPKFRASLVKRYFKWEESYASSDPSHRWVQDLSPWLVRAHILGPARIRIPSGLSLYLDPNDLVSGAIIRTGDWQPEIWQSLTASLPEGGVFIDVGAHIGIFSLQASKKVGPTGRVVSFEPNPETLKVLRENAAANHGANISIQPVAATDRQQELTLYASSTINSGASSLARENADIGGPDGTRAYKTLGRPVDDVVRELGLTRVDAIKIDVEGTELLVLKGAAETIRRFHPKVVLEVDAQHLAAFKVTPADLTAFFKDAGYTDSRPLNADQTDVEWIQVDPARFTTALAAADSLPAQFLRGFFPVEQNAWRWTGKSFAIALKASAAPARLTLKFSWPEVSFKQVGAVTISASAGGKSLPPMKFDTPGEHEYTAQVSAGAGEFEFTLDKSVGPTATDERILGLLYLSARLEK